MFILAMFMRRATNLGLFQGCQLPNDGPYISHLSYAEDVLFIGMWSEQNVIALNRLLRWISLVAGLKVNRSKCSLFGIGVNETEVNQFASIVQCQVGTLPFTHLGIPIDVNMKRAKYWKPVLDKFQSRLSKWKARFLSFAGRMTLVKAVLGSLPSYFLALFAAPKCVISKLEKIRRSFLWGKTDSGHKLRWVRWQLLQKSKKAGGMGVGSIQGYNFAMLAKWWWRFKSDPNQLWAKVVSAIHSDNGSNSTPPFFPLKRSLPGLWKDVGSVEAALAKIGINIKENLVVAGAEWKWQSDPNGSFSVKQVRIDIDRASSDSGIENFVYKWNNWATPKANFLLWRAILGKVASKVGLTHRGIPLSDCLCPRCWLHDEDPDHIFVNCLWSKCIWWNILAWVRIRFPADSNNLSSLISYIDNNPGGKVWRKIVGMIAIATVWKIWSARNKKVFEDIFIPVSKIVDQIKEETFMWVNNRANLKATSWGNWKSFDIIDLM
ncbi:putative RNA-directed DNA polymerase [Helianthus annuus]|nr:putative RNA-directed DNA polymerase [Helianthus annuus]